MVENDRTFYEFFAGGGMARLGLGKKWKCLLANELCEKKANAYRVNHKPNGELVIDDVANLTLARVPGQATLAWASFPCQDLSLAGAGRGLKGRRSGTFWPFWDLMGDLSDTGRPVPIIVLENVVGALTSNQGTDFQAIVDALILKGYVFGPMVIDAVHFLPQSRPRLFIVAVKSNTSFSKFAADKPSDHWHTKRILQAYDSLSDARRQYWVWWNLKSPKRGSYDLSAIIEEKPDGVKWHTKTETKRLLDMMSEANRKKVSEAQKHNKLIVGTVYKRTRAGEIGNRVQRAEVRFDQISGCLRTPVGGSSRQIVMVVNGKDISTRLLSTREAARLMGLPDSYKLPDRYNEAYHLAGDGLAVPVVSWLEKHLLTPLADQIKQVIMAKKPRVIPCELLPEVKETIHVYAEELKEQAYTIGSHGLSQKEFQDSGIFRSAVERLRGMQAASMHAKKDFMDEVLTFMQSSNKIKDWKFTGSGERHDYQVELPDGRISIIETKGCLDGNNTNIFERPPNADEFVIWSLCQNPGSDPRHNAWSGIHTRLGSEVIHRKQKVDGLVIWDMVCGTTGRPCPKVVAKPVRQTKMVSRNVPPPCIYLFPRSIPDPKNNPEPPVWKINEVGLLKALLDTFKGEDSDVIEVHIHARMHNADIQRKTSFMCLGDQLAESKWTSIKRASRQFTSNNHCLSVNRKQSLHKAIDLIHRNHGPAFPIFRLTGLVSPVY